VAWLGMARQGKPHLDVKFRRGFSWRGRARRGRASPGWAGRGKARQGKPHLYLTV